jgi:hypothetical protein
MLFARNSTKPVDKPNYPVKLYTFTGIVEQNLEYTLNLVLTIEDRCKVSITFAPYRQALKRTKKWHATGLQNRAILVKILKAATAVHSALIIFLKG